MLKFCMKGITKAVGLALIAFCAGVAAGALLPAAFVAVIETGLLIAFGYLCLFKS